MRKKILAGALGVGLVCTLGVGSAAYAEFDKAVKLTVDGKSRTIHSFGSTVGDVLAAEKLKTGRRDLVAPGPDTALTDGTEITVRFARPVTVTVDGKTSKHWVTALHVSQALRELDVRRAGAKVSVDRSSRIDRGGMRFRVLTAKDLTIVHDGGKSRVEAPVSDVAGALTAAGLEVDANDRVEPRLSAEVSDGQTIRIARVVQKEKRRTVDLPYETVRKPDGDLYEGETTEVRDGTQGEQTQLIRVTWVDGKKRDTRVVERTTTREPENRVVAYGTKEKQTSWPDVGGDVDSLNWEALAECESGGDPNAVNPNGHYGLYQFSLSTWASVGGSGNPVDASPAEQTYRAKLLYEAAGAGQWTCGSHLYD